MTGWVKGEKIEVGRKYECLASFFNLFLPFFFLQIKVKKKKMECKVPERTKVKD